MNKHTTELLTHKIERKNPKCCKCNNDGIYLIENHNNFAETTCPYFEIWEWTGDEWYYSGQQVYPFGKSSTSDGRYCDKHIEVRRNKFNGCLFVIEEGK